MFVWVLHLSSLHIAVIHSFSLLCDILLMTVKAICLSIFIVGKHLGYFQVGPIKSNLTVNTLTHISWYRCAFLQDGSAVSWDILRFNFNKYCPKMPMVVSSLYSYHYEYLWGFTVLLESMAWGLWSVLEHLVVVSLAIASVPFLLIWDSRYNDGNSLYHVSFISYILFCFSHPFISLFLALNVFFWPVFHFSNSFFFF